MNKMGRAKKDSKMAPFILANLKMGNEMEKEFSSSQINQFMKVSFKTTQLKAKANSSGQMDSPI